MLERLCSARKHPLSSISGRQRYNILDFANKVVCHETAGFIGSFLPRRTLPSIGCLPPRQLCRLWKPPPRERYPLWIPQPTGRFSPLLETQSQRNCRPFGIPARFEMSTHKWKMVCGHSFQNAKIPTAVPPARRGKTVGIFNAAFTGTGENFIRHPLLLRCNSRNTHSCPGEGKRHDFRLFHTMERTKLCCQSLILLENCDCNHINPHNCVMNTY